MLSRHERTENQIWRISNKGMKMKLDNMKRLAIDTAPDQKRTKNVNLLALRMINFAMT